MGGDAREGAETVAVVEGEALVVNAVGVLVTAEQIDEMVAGGHLEWQLRFQIKGEIMQGAHRPILDALLFGIWRGIAPLTWLYLGQFWANFGDFIF